MVVSTLAAWPEKLSADLIIRATCRWSRAQCRGLTCIPLLHRLFTPLGLTMIAPSFASLLTMFEAAAGRPIEIGARDRPESEERRVGVECGSTCRSTWSTHHQKKNKQVNVT